MDGEILESAADSRDASWQRHGHGHASRSAGWTPRNVASVGAANMPYASKRSCLIPFLTILVASPHHCANQQKNVDVVSCHLQLVEYGGSNQSLTALARRTTSTASHPIPAGTLHHYKKRERLCSLFYTVSIERRLALHLCKRIIFRIMLSYLV